MCQCVDSEDHDACGQCGVSMHGSSCVLVQYAHVSIRVHPECATEARTAVKVQYYQYMHDNKDTVLQTYICAWCGCTWQLPVEVLTEGESHGVCVSCADTIKQQYGL